MLLAMIIAGFAAAAIVPMVLSGDEDDDVDALPEGDESDLLEDLTISEGAIYEIPSVAAETVLNSFDPDLDRITINTDSWDTEFILEELEDGGVALRFDTPEGNASVVFPDLGELPVEAIEIAVQESDETVPSFVSLADIFDDEPEEETPVTPTDGDAEEDGGSSGDEADPLAPVDPDAPEPDNPDEPIDEVLPPTDPDAPEDAPGRPLDGEVLQLADPDTPDIVQVSKDLLYDDTLVFADRPLEITDFQDGDVLAVELLGHHADGETAVGLSSSGDGADTLVEVGGVLVAIVSGPGSIAPEQVHVSWPDDAQSLAPSMAAVESHS